MAIWEFDGKAVRPLETTTFSAEGVRERADLQKVLRENVGVIAPDTLVIAEEFGDWADSRRRIDLLGIDRNANLVVIELKRTEDGGHMELQAIRYAAMVSAMTFAKAVQVYADFLRGSGREDDAEAQLLEFLGWSDPEDGEFANEVSIVLASAEFSRELTTSVLWLIERGIDIRCVRLKPYTTGERLFLDVQQVLPLPEAGDYQVQLREKAEERRRARASSRDFTRYDLNVAGQEHRGLAKRWLVYRIVRAAIEAGAKPEDLIPLLPRGESRWVSVDGECNEAEFLDKLGEQQRPRGGAYDPRRYFTGDDELFRVAGRTYALSNQWARRGALAVASKVAEAYVKLNLQIRESAED